MPPRFMMVGIVALLLGGTLGFQFLPGRALRHGAGVIVAPEEPNQTLLAEYPLGPMSDYELTALANYAVTARVLSTRRYRYGMGSDLVPIDLALGWGRMSDEAVLDRLEITQSFRFYFVGWKGEPPIPGAEIMAHSANTHIIPANAGVRGQVLALRTGAVVNLTGQLVTATPPGGPVWRSSISRTDIGAGACELFLVETVAEVPVPTAAHP